MGRIAFNHTTRSVPGVSKCKFQFLRLRLELSESQSRDQVAVHVGYKRIENFQPEPNAELDFRIRFNLNRIRNFEFKIWFNQNQNRNSYVNRKFSRIHLKSMSTYIT